MGVLGVHFFYSLTIFLLSLKRLEKKPQADKSSSSCSTISKEELRVIDLTAHMLYVHAKKEKRVERHTRKKHQSRKNRTSIAVLARLPAWSSFFYTNYWITSFLCRFRVSSFLSHVAILAVIAVTLHIWFSLTRARERQKGWFFDDPWHS